MKFDASFFLRLGLAFTFLFAAISGFLNPQAWIGYIPGFIGNFITRGYFLLVHDMLLFILGVWLLLGKKTFYSAIISCLFILGIILANFGSFLITFRDVGLFFAAVALAVMSRKEK
jgi:hypothetical protein